MSYWQRLFDGRLGRMNYFLGMVLLSVSGMVLMIPLISTGIAIGISQGDKTVSIGSVVFLVVVSVIYAFFAILYSISFQTKRLHDLNQSGWLQLLGLVPMVNIGLSIYMTFFKGTEGKNNYGEPDGSFDFKKLLGLLQPAKETDTINISQV